MDATVVTYHRASDRGDAILAELDDRLRNEAANGYIGMTTPDRRGMVDIKFDGKVDKDLVHRRVGGVLDEIDAQAGQHVEPAEGAETGP